MCIIFVFITVAKFWGFEICIVYLITIIKFYLYFDCSYSRLVQADPLWGMWHLLEIIEHWCDSQQTVHWNLLNLILLLIVSYAFLWNYHQMGCSLKLKLFPLPGYLLKLDLVGGLALEKEGCCKMLVQWVVLQKDGDDAF